MAICITNWTHKSHYATVWILVMRWVRCVLSSWAHTLLEFRWSALESSWRQRSSISCKMCCNVVGKSQGPLTRAWILSVSSEGFNSRVMVPWNVLPLQRQYWMVWLLIGLWQELRLTFMIRMHQLYFASLCNPAKHKYPIAEAAYIHWHGSAANFITSSFEPMVTAVCIPEWDLKYNWFAVNMVSVFVRWTSPAVTVIEW